jgi:hypothetical protein
MLMLAEYMSLTRRRLSNSAREKEALAELMDNGGATSVKVGEIVRVALEQNDLVNCSKLFSNYHAYAQTERSKNRMSLESLVTPLGSSQILQATTPIEASVIKDSTIEKIWADDNIGVTADIEVKALDDINLEQMSSAIVDLLAEKLFSQGVHFNVNIAENLSVQGRAEDLEQTLFHLFNYAINSTQSGSGEKNISVVAHKLGDIVSFDLSHSGVGFDERILKQRAGLTTDNVALDLDLQICQSLLNEIQAKTQFDNKIDQSGNIVGGRVKVIFKAAKAAIKESSQGRLVDLKVGSKKEILASFNNG